MKKYAISFIDFHENDLIIKVVETDGSWKDALVKSQFVDDENAETLDDDMKNAKEQAFNQDWLFEVVEII